MTDAAAAAETTTRLSPWLVAQTVERLTGLLAAP